MTVKRNPLEVHSPHPAHDDERDLCGLGGRAELAEDGEAVRARHHDVADDGVRQLRPGDLEGLVAVTPHASEVRCWPHHFDIATLIEVVGATGAEPAHTIGAGMGPGDQYVPAQGAVSQLKITVPTVPEGHDPWLITHTPSTPSSTGPWCLALRGSVT